jgi:uncharacterized membrane protein YdbT with pleckstrin-like domain
MLEQVIRPSTKLIKAGYTVVVLLVVAGIVVHALYLQDQQYPLLPAACALLLLWPIQRHIRSRFTKATFIGDKLRYESGFLSKSTQTIQISRIQNARVDQTLGQRMLRTGDVSIETAGETSRLTIVNVDSPHEVADGIISASRRSDGAAQ